MLKAAFFTEAGTKRGMGHLIRCYCIYETFKQNNIKSSFFLDSDMNYNYKFNDIKYFKWNELNFENNYDIVFIDSYEAPKKLYDSLSKKVKLLISIDDYGRLKYPKGIIINFAPDSDKLFFQNKKNTSSYLLGLDYIPIRKEFLQTKVQKQQQIFIMLGGNDIANLSEEILSSLNNLNILKIVVTNSQQKIKKLSSFNNIKILYKPNDNELIKAMASSSLAISTASMTLYELSYLNIPSIIVAINYNQKIGAFQSIKYNLAVKLLDIEQNNWKEELYNYIEQNKFRDKINTTPVIDGKGVKRIFDKIKEVFNL